MEESGLIKKEEEEEKEKTGEKEGQVKQKRYIYIIGFFFNALSTAMVTAG